MLQRNAPLPARLSRDGTGIRRDILARRRLHGKRAVREQPRAVVLEPGLQRLLDEKAAKAGAVDEEITRDGFAGLEIERRDVARLRVLIHRLDLAFDAFDALGLAELA